jgi:hypothetical protein
MRAGVQRARRTKAPRKTLPLVFLGENRTEFTMWPFRRKRIVEPPIFWLGPRDPISMPQTYEGVLGIGATGSGKTSTLAHLMLALMRRGAGMLFLTAKADDIDMISALAMMAGRGDDLVEFGPGKPSRLDFLNYELSSPGGSIRTAG